MFWSKTGACTQILEQVTKVGMENTLDYFTPQKSFITLAPGDDVIKLFIYRKNRIDRLYLALVFSLV